ncbi:hypothetical protein MAPG_02977 [Magnaporthiopsis poae ATCC 64411]|uniref:Uncharacterized protein n=1 Tax=Magnaporthiopsis poae (strain ATCC 64411 / 73-15) TaxID=644358 RepID=A0A0C4DST6_MAGP6|nr:hypothetical protein MAPG_02977 [Magnaporthiopsis poae ATCC 64411]
MRQTGDGDEPSDLINPEDVTMFQKDLAALFGKPHGDPSDLAAEGELARLSSLPWAFLG